MPAEARITPIWKKQKLFVSLFLIAIGGWFFWDGKIGYPKDNERWVEHEDFLQNGGHEQDWPDFAKSQGWSAKLAHKFHTREDIIGQFVFGGLAALAGAITFAYWASQKGRVLKSDADSVTTPSGTRVPFTAISGVGKKKWDAKGLATVRYEIDGRKGEFILDDYKFDREATHTILAEIEANAKPKA
jgi:hypothetical protein